jgi:hypothetical protein
MFSKIVVALNDLPESQRALRAEIELARTSNAELATVSILGDLPAYTSFAIVIDPSAPDAMKEGRRRTHLELHDRSRPRSTESARKVRSWRGGKCRRYFISLKMNVPFFLLLAFISTTSIYRVFGVPFMTSLRKLPAAYSVSTERAGQNQRGISVGIGLASEALRHE